MRTKGANGFADVHLDCRGQTPLTGWQPLGATGTYEYTRVDLVTGNFQQQNGCDNGRHEMHSTQPFGLTVWGWGSRRRSRSLDVRELRVPGGRERASRSTSSSSPRSRTDARPA